jgi:hypothetical protein
VDSLRWPLVREQEQHSDGLSEDVQAIAAKLNDLLGRMADYSAARGTTDYSTARQVLFSKIQGTQKELHELIANDIESKASFEKVTGVALTMRPDLAGITCHEDGSPKFEVHSLRRAARVGPDGHVLNQAIISITQKRLLPLDEDETGDDARKFAFRGGCTLIFDLDTLKLRYSIRKEIDSAERLEKERRYRREGLAGTLRATYFAAGAVAEEPFALLHRGPSEENA